MSNTLTRVVARKRIDASSANIATNAWSELAAAATRPVINMIQVENTTTQTLEIGIGASSSEVAIASFYILPTGGSLPVHIPADVRIVVRAVGTAATTGVLVVNFLN